MAGMKGSSIDVPIPSAIAAVSVTPATTPPANSDVSPTSISVVMNQWYESPFYLTDRDIMEAMDGIIPMQASAAIRSLVNVVDQSILAKYTSFYGFQGVPGTTPFTGSAGGASTSYPGGRTYDANQLRKVLNKQLAPLDNRSVIMDPECEAAMLDVRAFQDMNFSGSAMAILEGKIEQKLGFGWHMNQNTPSHTAGTAANMVTNNVAGYAIGTKTLAIDVGTGTLVVGDIITFAGHSQTYVVTEAESGNATTLKIEPGLVVAVADDVAVTVKGAGTTYTNNLAFHRDAIAFASRPLVAHGAELGVISQSMVDPISGLALRLEITHQHKQVRFSYDILWGVEVTRRELGARLAG